MNNNLEALVNIVSVTEEKISYSELAYKALNGDINAAERLEAVMTDNKKLCIYEFIKSMTLVSSRYQVFYGIIDGIPVIVDDRNKKLYRDGRNKRELKLINEELYALDKKKGWVKIFTSDGEFDWSRIKFADGCTTAGSKGYKAIKLCTKKYGNVKLRNHFFMSAILYGTLVLDCIGEDRLFDIDHVDGVHTNNSLDNLQIITHLDNIRKYARMAYDKYRTNWFKWFGYRLPEYDMQTA